MSLTLFSLVVSQTTDNGTPKCGQSDRSLLYLEAASEMITKAKLYYPTSPVITQNEKSSPMDCTDVLRNGYNQSGVYTIWPKSRLTDGKPLDVFCDMDTDDGGWTVLQRRGDFNRSNDYFFQDWASYKSGFGDIRKNFWIGNDNMFALTNQRLYSIRIDLQDFEGARRYAVYDTFWIDDENNKYTLHIKDYSGDAGDSMTPNHDKQKFTTKDQDNDFHKEKNCAQEYKGAWWYFSCHWSNLNGLYLRGKHETRGTGVNWNNWKGSNESLKTTEMKIRPKTFWKNLILLDTPEAF
ncbi:Techylectin-5A [Araneus ventricosus]|uniref:Techylectin-5A n=1 Tax=Araneus ventricosus TaxID=182803 RepID=A0A4Y2T5T0_ARAVE|nr:Techylectin-5A [Araneus ventricosus]